MCPEVLWSIGAFALLVTGCSTGGPKATPPISVDPPSVVIQKTIQIPTTSLTTDPMGVRMGLPVGS